MFTLEGLCRAALSIILNSIFYNFLVLFYFLVFLLYHFQKQQCHMLTPRDFKLKFSKTVLKKAGKLLLLVFFCVPKVILSNYAKMGYAHTYTQLMYITRSCVHRTNV